MHRRVANALLPCAASDSLRYVCLSPCAASPAFLQRRCEQQAISKPAEDTRPCDLDYFALSIRRHVGSRPERLLEKDVVNAIKHASLQARSTKLVVESKHARRRAFREMRHQIRSHTLSCAEYVLRGCARLHADGLRKRGLASRRSRRVCRPGRAKEHPKRHAKKRSALTYLNKKSAAFIRRHGRCTRQRLNELKASWLTEWKGYTRQEQLVLGSPDEVPGCCRCRWAGCLRAVSEASFGSACWLPANLHWPLSARQLRVPFAPRAPGVFYQRPARSSGSGCRCHRGGGKPDQRACPTCFFPG
jgi:hypothetical protein